MSTINSILGPTWGLPPALLAKAAELLPEIQLQDHQQRVADRISGDDPRLLVYHGLGSGKSLSSLAAAEEAKKKYNEDYGVVVPASLRGNFEKEINKFTRGSNPEIMSYTGLALGKKFQTPPDTLIVDEAHRLRNPGSASSAGAAEAAAQAKRLMLLTGSPITNSPTDLANLLSMLHNKQITPEEFEKRYIDYKTVRPGLLGWLRGVKPGVKPVVKNEKELRSLLQGKVDYQPSKTPEGVDVKEEVVRVPLSPAQDKIQKAIRTKIPPGFLWKLDQEFPLSKDELAKLNSFLTGLRQVSLSTQPFRADKDPAKAFQQSAKLQTAFQNLQKTLAEDKRKKAIIYSNFIDSGLAPYAAGLEKAKIPHAFFHGGVSPKARQAAVDAYNQGQLRALLIGPAGAEGLSTKGTSLIQLLDPHWHESRSQQAQGRGLRFDSHRDLPEELKNVQVQRYLSASQDPSFVGKLMGYKRERTGDEVLEHLTAEKEQLNEVFRKILKDEGDKYRKQREQEKQSVARWRMPDALLAFAKKQLNPALAPNGYKNLTRGEALENAAAQLGRPTAQQNFEAPISKFFSGFNKKLLAEATPSSIPVVTAIEPTVLFRKLRSAHPHPKATNPVPYVHGSPHAGALANAHYGNSLFSGYLGGRTPLLARYKTAPGQTYGPDYHLDSGLPGMPWAAIPANLRPRQGATYETPLTTANEFLGYGVGLPGGSEKYYTLPNTPEWKKIFGGKHGLMRELQTAPQSQITRTPDTVVQGKQQAENALKIMRQKTSAELPEFQPDFTPGQLHRMGVYKSLYEKEGPRLASLGEWKPEWVTEHDPKGWLEWYQNYNSGRRIPEEDTRQIKRWASFKARHGGPFMRTPTPRRGWALRNWAIDPAKLVPPTKADRVRTMLEAYQEQELQKYLKRRRRELTNTPAPEEKSGVFRPLKLTPTTTKRAPSKKKRRLLKYPTAKPQPSQSILEPNEEDK
jgi:hypothetical protein